MIIAAGGMLATVVLGIVAIAIAEGVFDDPGGNLNQPFKLVCDTGLLANRTVTIYEDGEYNWMLARGQMINISLTEKSGQPVQAPFDRDGGGLQRLGLA